MTFFSSPRIPLVFLFLSLLLPGTMSHAGEPPPPNPSLSLPGRPPAWTPEWTVSIAPRAVLMPLPQEEARWPNLTRKILRRLQQTGYVLHRPPPPHYLIGALDRQHLIGQHDAVLIRAPASPPGTEYILHRPGPLLVDPVTGEPLGVLSLYVGSLTTQYVVASGTVARITDSPRAIAAGDHLMEKNQSAPPFRIHTTPAAPMEGRILRIENDLEMAGSDQLFAVGLGRRQRATLGLMLPIYQTSQGLADPYTQQEVPLPSRLIGHAVLIRVGEKASLAFLVDSTRPVRVGDRMGTQP